MGRVLSGQDFENLQPSPPGGCLPEGEVVMPN
jgi:hypothetical protein